MKILRALYNQEVESLFPQVEAPVLICVADDGTEWSKRKKAQVRTAEKGLQQVAVSWFPGAAHDIHVDQPSELTRHLLAFGNRLAGLASR